MFSCTLDVLQMLLLYYGSHSLIAYLQFQVYNIHFKSGVQSFVFYAVLMQIFIENFSLTHHAAVALSFRLLPRSSHYLKEMFNFSSIKFINLIPLDFIFKSN